MATAASQRQHLQVVLFLIGELEDIDTLDLNTKSGGDERPLALAGFLEDEVLPLAFGPQRA